jgi:hypothetical protein
MLNGGASLALAANCSPSKPQIELFELTKQLYPSAIIDHRLKEINKVLDIAIPEILLDIEYDGSYWHQDAGADLVRENKIKSIGWKVIRFRDYIPTIDELNNKIQEVINYVRI